MSTPLIDRLIEHEGLRLKPYTDTAGKLTIGIGRNLADRGITRGEALMLLTNDLAGARGDLDRNAPWWRKLDEARREVLLELCFAMGWPALSGFHAMLGALQLERYNEAEIELLNSRWADQTDGKQDRIASARAVRLAAILRTGEVVAA